MKILTKGCVTLNSAYLLSPMAILLLDRHPDLFNGPAILPAFRDDKTALSDLLASNEDMAAQGFDAQRVADHISRLDTLITRVMPWSLGDVGEKFRALLVSGLENPTSLVVRALGDEGFADTDIVKLIDDLKTCLSPRASPWTPTSHPSRRPCRRRFVTTRPPATKWSGPASCVARPAPISAPFQPSSRAMSSSPRETAAPDRLSEEALFLEAFMGLALDTIPSAALPTQILDSPNFTTVHALSDALRAQGFQDKYDGIARRYLATAALPTDDAMLAGLEPEAIAHVAADLAATFKQAIIAELPHYTTQAQTDAQARVIETRGDIAKTSSPWCPALGRSSPWRIR